MIRIFKIFLCAAFAKVVAASFVGGFFLAYNNCAAAGVILTPSRAKLVKTAFEESMKKFGADFGALCLVGNGEIFIAETISGAKAKNLPLGRTSLAPLSLMYLEMQRRGFVPSHSIASDVCSFFRIRGGEKITVQNLLLSNAGIDPHSDSLVPRDASAAEVFDIAAQLPLISGNSDFNAAEYSKLSVSCGAYILAYVFDKKEKNFKKSFAAASQKFLFAPLKIAAQTYRNFDSPLFPAEAYALDIKDVAKWLACETSPTPPLSDSKKIAARRISPGYANAGATAGARFAGAWLNTSERGVDLQISGCTFQGYTHIVAIAPVQNLAAAFFVRGKSPKLCAAMLSQFVDMIRNPLE